MVLIRSLFHYVNETSEDICLWIVDSSTFEYLMYLIPIEEYYTAFAGQPRIDFVEKHIEKFKNDDNKELFDFDNIN